MICQHCRRTVACRPRQLCWVCYHTPGVRELYPGTSKHARRGVGNCCGNRPLPAIPTRASPGSPEKLTVLAERASLKLCLFHPEDVTEKNPGLEMLRAS